MPQAPIGEEEVELPSPWQLRKKILIKAKRLPPANSDVTDVTDEKDESEDEGKDEEDKAQF